MRPGDLLEDTSGGDASAGRYLGVPSSAISPLPVLGGGQARQGWGHRQERRDAETVIVARGHAAAATVGMDADHGPRRADRMQAPELPPSVSNAFGFIETSMNDVAVAGLSGVGRPG